MNSRSTGWIITINYLNKEPIHDKELERQLQKLEDIQYYIFQLEQGEKENVKHHQMYLLFTKRKYFTWIKEQFPTAHIEQRRGSHIQAKEYCSKTDTRVSLTNEWGDENEQGKRNDLSDILDMIYEGRSINDIINTYPSQYLRYRNNIEHLYERHKSELTLKTFRQLQVTYVWGKTGVGKTSTIMKHHGFDKVYRITDYKHPFDTYQGQDIIIFDEFHSQIKIELMLNLLDGYPLKLPARYNDKTAQYKQVYIISNEPLDKQYPNVQKHYQDTFNALRRRIHNIFTMEQLQIHIQLPF
jgi:hypothetical protein